MPGNSSVCVGDSRVKKVVLLIDKYLQGWIMNCNKEINYFDGVKWPASVLCIALLVGCAGNPSASKSEKDAEPGIVTPLSSNQQLTTAFAGMGVKLTFGKDGQWERITSTGVAPMGRNEVTGAETAVTVATMKARRQISEFVKTEISSKQVVTIIADTIRDGSKEGGDSESYARKLSDQITQTSSAILRGVMIESTNVNPEAGTATVVVYADRKTLQVANGMLKAN